MTTGTKPTFNVLDEPWIPVRTHDGDVREVGLKEVFSHASGYSDLAETSPPNLIALYRLLLAVLHRALTTQYGPWKDTDRARWFRDGLPQDIVQAYLERWRDRFWLFHATHPFMQVAALAEAEQTRNKLKPVSQLALESSTGNMVLLFDHSLDERPTAMTYAAACRSLLGLCQFTPGGLVKTVRDSDKAGPLANTAAVMPLGRNLSETLLMGLHPYDASRPNDLPAWERSSPGIDALLAPPSLATGPNDRYTRLARAVLLLPDAAPGEIRQIRFAAGLALEEDMNAPDPMACYRISKNERPIRVTFTEGRAVWRDLPSLVPDASRANDIPPAILGWAADLLMILGEWDIDVPILTAGLASDQAKLLRWRIERLVLPKAMLTNPDASAELRAQVRLAERRYRELNSFLSEMIVQTMPDPEHKDTRSRARQILEQSPACTEFFSTAERALSALMKQIAGGEVDIAVRSWQQALVGAAEDIWETVRRGMGNSPAALRAEARVWPRFSGWLKSMTPPSTEA